MTRTRAERAAVRTVTALGRGWPYEKLAPVILALGHIPPGGSRELHGLTVERMSAPRGTHPRAQLFRIARPWCGRKLSGAFGPAGPVARRILEEALVRSWR